MPRNELARVAVLLLAVGCFAVGCRSAVRALLVPDEPFDPATVPAAPDYAKSSSWAALPTRADNADVVPEGETDGQASAVVDVFFIHPTTYYEDEHWNQPLEHEKANEFTDQRVLKNQASAFNAVARVYAPRYRQVTLGAFLTTDDRVADSRAALDVAYGDVKAAFSYYLEHYNQGRPIIIASHSQGSRHAVPLLGEFFAGKPLAKQLVAAYVIGFPIPADHFQRTLAPIGPCQSEDDTGCLVTWATYIEGAEIQPRKTFIPYDGKYEDIAGKTVHCTNPLAWTTGTATAAADAHDGAVMFEPDEQSAVIDRGYVRTARCTDGKGEAGGALFVELEGRKYPRMGKNLHLSDYQLFYMDIRRNVAKRAAAFAGRSVE
jgi:hypothetical protein